MDTFLPRTLTVRTLLAGVGLACALVTPSRTLAQAAPVLARVDSLVTARDTVRARAIVDSVLADTDPSATVYPDALYWRGALAGLPLGRADLLKLIVNFPLHQRAGDALYLLAREDLAAGNRDAAARRLERITRDFAGSDVGPLASVELARLELAQGNMAAACTAFDSALAYIPDADVERRNRVAYDARPCEQYRADQADSIAAAQAAAVRDSVVRDSLERATAAASRRPKAAAARGTSPRPGSSANRGASAAAGKWSVQVAAYAARADATRLEARLKELGYAARVTGTGPFRVRVGRFASLADASAMAQKLKAAKFTAIVVETERP